MSAAVRAEPGYSRAPLVLCDVYEHTNGKQYHAVKRARFDWSYVAGRVDSHEGVERISLFAINPKTGRAWQAARYLKTADVKLVGTIEV